MVATEKGGSATRAGNGESRSKAKAFDLESFFGVLESYGNLIKVKKGS
jgi:hypothetical protein